MGGNVECVFPTLARDDCTRDEYLVQDSFSENLKLAGERWGAERETDSAEDSMWLEL